MKKVKFWGDGAGWAFFMFQWKWIMLGKVYFGWVEKGGLFLWISGDGWTFFKGGFS